MSSKHSAQGRFSGKLRDLFAHPALVLFFVFIFGLFFADLLTPDKARSEIENTALTQRPAITLADLAGGKAASKINSYFTSYTRYVKDQVVARDTWVSLQSVFETALFQKTQNGNVLLGRGGKMFTRTYSLLASEQTRLPMNTQAVADLATRWPGLVSVMVAPSASTVTPGDVPANAPLVDEDAYLDDAFAAMAAAGADVLDLRGTLEEHKDEYIYYRTDHHWTSLGAYYAYEQYCTAQGLTPFDCSTHTAVEVPDFYGTSYAKARTFNAVPDTLTYYDLPNEMTVYKVTGPTTAEPESVTGLYDLAKLDEYDKYAAFLYGNNGYSRIKGDGEGSILVIKDSYANSLVPYLTANYAAIDVIDLRNYTYAMDSLIEANGYDQVLVLYNFASFKADTKLARLSVKG